MNFGLNRPRGVIIAHLSRRLIDQLIVYIFKHLFAQKETIAHLRPSMPRRLNEPAHEIMVLITHRRPAKAQASLPIRSVSPEPSLAAHIKYGSRRMVRPKIRHLAPLDG